MKTGTIGRLAVLAGLAWQGAEARAQQEDGKDHDLHAKAPRAVKTYKDALSQYHAQGQNFQRGSADFFGPVQLQPGAEPNRFFVTTFRDASDDALGLTLVPVPDRLRAQLKLPKDQGLIASAIDPEGPAARVGLRLNDILLSLGHEGLAKSEDLAAHLKEADDAKPLELKVLRAGKPVTVKVRRVVSVTLGPVDEEKETTEYFIGVAVSIPDDALRGHLEIPDDRGLLVDQVVKESAAEKGGVKQNDVLLSIAGKPLDGTEALVKEVREAKDKPTELRLIREGTPLTVVVTPEKRSVKAPQATIRAPLRMWMVDPANPNAPRLDNLNLRLGQKFEGAPGTTFSFKPAVPAAPDARLDKLEGELKSLREAIDGLKDALKSSEKGRD